MDNPHIDFLDSIDSLSGVVPGRVLHIDGDVISWMVSPYDISFEDMCRNADSMIQAFKESARAEKVIIHITHENSKKANRPDIAIQAEYQCNRKGKQKPEYLHAVRAWLGETYQAVINELLEADDSMSILQNDCIRKGIDSVILTKDKDLRMVIGKHMIWDTHEIVEVKDSFGYIELDRSKSSTKLVGYGTKFFWAQLLMGDSADNITGLPLVHRDGILRYTTHTSTITKLLSDLNIPSKTDAAREKLLALKPKKAGPVLVYDILKDCTTDRECFEICKDLYKTHGDIIGYTNYRTDEVVSWSSVLFSEMRLLWMHRTTEPYSLVSFLQEIVHA